MTVIDIPTVEIVEFTEEEEGQKVEHALCRYCYPPELAPHPEYIAACGATVKWSEEDLPQCPRCIEVVSRLDACPRCGGQ